MEIANQLEDVNEEFNNFMLRVNEVNKIVNQMASKDQTTRDMGVAAADVLLNRKTELMVENLDEGDVVLNIKSDKTILNYKALHEPERKDENTMSQEAFMNEVSKDAEKRHKDRLVRTEKMETFKKQATLAFRRGEYEKALVCYDKALQQIKDSVLLYNNRGLTQMNLGRYDRAIEDFEFALKLNENCLRSYLLLAKANYLKGTMPAFEDIIKEAKERNPKMILIIDDFVDELKELNNKS